MALDGLVFHTLIQELIPNLTGARVDKVTQPKPYDIILTVRNNRKNHKLLLSINPNSPKILLTEQSFQNPMKAPNFCMLLRKHLTGSKILKLETDGFERVLNIHFSSLNELGDTTYKTLVIEIMGRHSNIILLNDKKIILDSLKHVDERINRVRQILPARPYVSPPKQTKMPIEDVLNTDLDLFLEPDKTIEKALISSIQGISPFFVALCLKTIDPKTLVSELQPGDKQKIQQSLKQNIQKILDQKTEPTLYFSPDQNFLDYHVIHEANTGFETQTFSNLFDLLETYDLYQAKRNHFNLEYQKLEKILKQQLDQLKKLEKVYQQDINTSQNYEDLKRYGELLLSYIHIKEPLPESLVVQNYYADPVTDIAIPLFPNRSISQCAQIYFKQYHKAQSKYNNAQNFLKKNHIQQTYAQSILDQLIHAEKDEDLAAIEEEIRLNNWIKEDKKHKENKKSEKSKPNKYLSPNGLVIWVGKNNIQNDHLTFSVANKQDYWFHVKDQPGTHVILKSNGPADSIDIETAARLAAWSSRSIHKQTQALKAANIAIEKQSFEKLPVDYCPASHVKKIPGSKPGMVTYTQYQTIMVSPLNPKTLDQKEP